MTEYDYSPDAYERYLAKQASIARWVDNTHEFSPVDPSHPLPDLSDDRGPLPSPAPYLVQPNPAFPPAPTYGYYTSGSARRHKSKHNRRHSNFTMDSQSSASFGLPFGGGLYMGATQAQLAQPMSTASMTTTSVYPQYQWFPYGSPPISSSVTSAMQVPLGSQPQFPGYPYTHPYPSPSIASNSPSAYRADNVYGYPEHSSSSAQSLPPTPSGTYVQNPNQHVVVPLSGGGFLVLPPGQQVQVVSAKDYYAKERDHDTDSDYSKPSFFGRLGHGRKKSKASSRDGSRGR